MRGADDSRLHTAGRLRVWLGLWILLAAWSGACSRASERPGTPPKNLLLVTASSLRRDHLSAYLYGRPTSAWPASEEERRQARALALDDLAAQGVLFADASSGSPRQFPALCSLFTGARGSVAGDPAQDQALEAGAVTLAEGFQAAGFSTAAFVAGAWLKDARGLDQGFENFQWRFSDAAVLELARQWLEEAEQRPDRPWFVWVHLAGGDPPHDPRGLPAVPGEAQGVLDFSRLFSNPAYGGSADGSLAYLSKLARGEAVPDEQDRARVIDLYDGEVARLAAGVRTLALSLRNLDPEGQRWRDTAMAFAGINGIELGERDPRAWGSDSLALTVVGVPLFLRHPGSLTGSRIMAEPVGLEDVAPTLREWFGLPSPARAPGGLVGRSLFPMLDSYVERPFERRPARWEITGTAPARALRTREHSLLETTTAGGVRRELFDRVADPDERHDIAGQEPARVAELNAELQRMKFHGARSP